MVQARAATDEVKFDKRSKPEAPAHERNENRQVKIRTAALANRIPTMTTLRGTNAALKAIKSLQGSEVSVRALQEYHW